MLPSEAMTGAILVCLAIDQFRDPLARELPLGPPEINGDLLLWKSPYLPLDGMLIHCDNGENLRIKRYLDIFYVAMPDDEGAREHLVHEFFEWIAEKYERLVDPQRNIENIDNLLTLLKRQGVERKDQLVLDFGCGIGLSKRSCGCGEASIVGFDWSPTMRRLTQEAGMEVWSPDDLLRKEPGIIDGTFASYVLHTATGATALKHVVGLMKHTAVFTANFHKGAGISWANNLFESLGMRVVFEEPGEAGGHGPSVVYGR